MHDIHHLISEGVAVREAGDRGRLVLLGQDRIGFLQGQATQQMEGLDNWQGVYTTFVTNKGKLQSEGWVHVMPEEVLLDLSEGTGDFICQRLENYIVADDVEVVDASPFYGVLEIFGPGGPAFFSGIGLLDDGAPAPDRPGAILKFDHAHLGECYLSRVDHGLGPEWHLFIPAEMQNPLKELIDDYIESGTAGFPAAWLEEAARASWRIHCGVPKFGVDMTEDNLPPEGGLDAAGISYRKGCYIGQEVLNRLRAMGSVTKKVVRVEISGMRVDDPIEDPQGIPLLVDGRERGKITSLCRLIDGSGRVGGLATVRKPLWEPGTELLWRNSEGMEGAAVVVGPAFTSFPDSSSSSD